MQSAANPIEIVRKKTIDVCIFEKLKVKEGSRTVVLCHKALIQYALNRITSFLLFILLLVHVVAVLLILLLKLLNCTRFIDSSVEIENCTRFHSD